MNFISSFLVVSAAVICDRRGTKGGDVTYVTVGTVEAVEGRSRLAPTLSDAFTTVAAAAGVDVDAGTGSKNVREEGKK